jgi:hypothetical protein
MRLLGILAVLFAASWAIGGGRLGPSDEPTRESRNQERLLAPVYRGSIEVEGWTAAYSTVERRDEIRAFLSKAPMAKVRSYYEEALGPFESVSIEELDHPDPDGDTEQLYVAARIVMTAEEVGDIYDWVCPSRGRRGYRSGLLSRDGAHGRTGTRSCNLSSSSS